MIHIYRGYPTTHIKDWINEHIDIDYSKIPFYIEALEDGNVKLAKIGSPTEISLLYSFDNKNWNNWDYTTGTDLKAGEKLYLKSSNNNGKFSTTGGNCYTFNFSSNVNIFGNIMSLIYNSFYDKKEINSSYCFCYLFSTCLSLINASNLNLPATILTENCYFGMFSGCTSLTSTPELPATTLARSCYDYMFNSCKSLTSMPKLPATKLASCCYFDMFYGCNNLTSNIYLSATILAESCYYEMFNMCLKISEIHYPKSIENDSTFTSMISSPRFGAKNATVYYDL